MHHPIMLILLTFIFRFWNPFGIWKYDGGNKQKIDNVQNMFQILFIARNWL